MSNSERGTNYQEIKTMDHLPTNPADYFDQHPVSLDKAEIYRQTCEPLIAALENK